VRALLVTLGLLLAVPAHTVSRFGIAVRVSSGWHVRIAPGALRAANARLNLVLFEDPPDPNGIYHHGDPAPFVRSSFGPPDGQAPGYGYARRNFTVAGRYFSLFVQARARHPGGATIRELNGFVRSLRIARGDFFPGRAPPARFQPAAGWHTRHSPTLAVSPSTLSIAIASTVPYRDCLNCFPPRDTVVQMRPDDVVIVLDLTADDRFPPTARHGRAIRGRLVLARAQLQCGRFEGMARHVATCSIHAQVRSQYDIDGWVVYGRPHPTAAQKARAQVELDRLVLPRWPRWS
jgi:hypothetical protein